MAIRDVWSPYTKVFIIINKIKIAETNVKSKPKTELIASGAVEKAVIPSKAYLNNFQNDHFVSPATLSTFSYSIHFVSNPTKDVKPFYNL